MHPQPQLRVPADVHLEDVGAALRELAHGIGRVGGRRIDGMLVDEAVTAARQGQREHGNHGRAGAQRQRRERRGCRRRPPEEVHVDRVGRVQVLIDQQRHRVIGGKLAEHFPHGDLAVDHGVARACADPLEHLVEPRVVLQDGRAGRERTAVDAAILARHAHGMGHCCRR